MPMTVAPTACSAADELLLVVGEARLDEHDVHPHILSAFCRCRRACTREAGPEGAIPAVRARPTTARVAGQPRMRCYRPPPMANVVFVAPYALDATTRFVNAVVGVPDTRRSASSAAIRQERFPESVRERLAGHWRHRTTAWTRTQLAAGVAPARPAPRRRRPPAGHPREPAGAPGRGPRARSASPAWAPRSPTTSATRRPDEDRVRARPASRARATAAPTTPTDALAFADGVSACPFVVKPLAGAGARGTFRIEDGDQLERWLSTAGLSRERPRDAGGVPGRRRALLRQRRCIDGQLVWHSIGRYLPTPLERAREPLDPVVRAAPPPHRRGAVPRGHRRRGPRRAGPRAAHGLLPHGVVPAARRIGRRLRGRRPPARRAVHDADVVGARHRPVRDVGPLRRARRVRSPAPAVRGRRRLPPRPGLRADRSAPSTGSTG